MAMHYYTTTLPMKASELVCNGCGAVMVYYRNTAALFYGI